MQHVPRFPLAQLVILSALVLFPLLPTAAAMSQEPPAPTPMPILPERLEQWRREGKTIPAFVTDPAFFAGQGINRPFRRAAPLLGPINALAVVVEFSDNVHTVTPTYFDHLIFDPPVSGRGSVRDYYEEVSYGQVDIITVDLPSSLDWMMAPQTYDYYVAGNTCFGGYPRNCQKLAEDIVDAINTAFPGLDFSDYDNDHDGVMEPIMLIHAGPGYEITGDPNDIWSHSWNLAYPRFYDGVTIADYVTMPEYRYTVDPNNSDATIGVFCHEMGHGFWGFPDLYDYDSSSWGVGYWSLMGYGGYGGPGHDGSSPSWPDAWCRVYAGFETSTLLQDPALITFTAVQESPNVFRLESDPLQTMEYFLLENRQQLPNTYDEYLPGSGLLIWHIDDTLMGYGPNNNECRHIPHCSGDCAYSHYLVALEQADGYDHLEFRLNGGDPSDPFPGNSNRTFWQPFAENPGVNPESGTWFDSGCMTDSCIDLTDIACEPLGDCTAYLRRADCAAAAELGDAPASQNHSDAPMTAYGAAGPLPDVPAAFPTVYLPLVAGPGPRHRDATAGCWLGDTVSGEWNADLPPDDDGALNLDPTGDLADRDGADDGLALPLILAPCAETTLAYTLTVAPSVPPAPRYANAWVDWNRDGDWADTLTCTGGLTAPEWAVQDESWTLGAGAYPLTATVAVPAPIVAEGAPLEAWLRLSVAEAPAPAPQDGRGPAGGYDMGETEDYLLTLSPTLGLTTTVERPLPGETFAYTVDLGSVGNVVAAGTVLSNALPAEVDYVSSVPTGTYNPTAHTITWTMDLVPDQAQAVTVTVQLHDGVPPHTPFTDTVALLWGSATWQSDTLGLVSSGLIAGAAFTYTLPACAGLPVQFINLSTGDPPLSFTWDLDGDGLTDTTVPSPTWVYTVSADYIVTLYAYNCCGQDHVSHTVPVLQPLLGVTAAGPAGLLVGEEATYTAVPTPTNASDPTYSWDNGSAGITATYAWDAPGTYTVAVTGSSACGGQVTGTLDVVVCGPLDGVAITGPVTLKAGVEGLFFATPEPPTTTAPAYLWDNGSVSSSTIYSWSLPGTYTVTVTATNCLETVVRDRFAVTVWQEYRIYLPLVVRSRP